MRVMIKCAEPDKSHLIISDEVFDITGWVELDFEVFDEIENKVIGHTTAELHIDELFRACQPFYKRWIEERKIDK